MTAREASGGDQAGYVQIGRGARLEGKLSGAGAVIVQGELAGEVELDGDLLVGSGGWVEGRPARATRVRVDGKASGSLKVKGALEVGAGGALEGRAQARQLQVSPEAVLEADLNVKP
jgi:cytoskeletal protein CcmA (bactofilin family)